MPEIRIDPLTGAQAIIAAERSRRPGGGPTCTAAPEIDRASDPFAEGNERLTPPELYALRPDSSPADGPGWLVRVVPNLYPALEAEPRAARRAAADGEPDLFARRAAWGAHEVIINAPQSVCSLAALPVEQLELAMRTWRARLREHDGSAYVQLIVNERAEAGASLPHTHAQLYALPLLPESVKRQTERSAAFSERNGGESLIEQVLAAELASGDRVIAADDDLVLLAPYASRLPYQMMLAPRKADARFQDDGPLGAELLHRGLVKLARLLGSPPPLNIYLRNAPGGAERFGWQLQIIPRLTHIAGLELSTDLYLNIVAPEHAAALLREH